LACCSDGHFHPPGERRSLGCFAGESRNPPLREDFALSELAVYLSKRLQTKIATGQELTKEAHKRNTNFI
jgi:hypothetical protein